MVTSYEKIVTSYEMLVTSYKAAYPDIFFRKLNAYQ